ncbi:MAG: hypothetical protein R3199_10265 [Gemmatimonadota bacterium]|nr:hypothetical protein [Gemmatimonadota bacterium]
MHEVAHGVFSWSRHSERLGYELNGFWWGEDGAVVVVDPPELTGAARAHMEEHGTPTLIVVTNHSHWRATDEVREWSDATVAMSAVDAEAVDGEVGSILADGDEVPGGWRVIGMPGKTPGEIGLHREEEEGIALVGDSLIGDPPGELRLLPVEKIADRAQLITSLSRLASLDFERLLVGDGEPLLHDADRRVRRFVGELT